MRDLDGVLNGNLKKSCFDITFSKQTRIMLIEKLLHATQIHNKS